MKSTTKKSIGAVFGVIIILLFLRTLYINWSQIQDFKFEFNIPLYILSTLILILIVFLWGGLWNLLLRDLNYKQLSFNESFSIQLQAWFGKYIPGKVGLIGIKYYLGTKKGISSKAIGISIFYENIFQVLSAFLISVPILFYYLLKELGDNLILYQILPLLTIVGLFVFIHPKVFFLFVNLGLKLFKKQPISKRYFLSSGQILKYLVLYSIAIIANGIAFFLFIRSITPLSLDYLLPTIGVFNFAGVIGLLAVFAPAGLGVREGVIVLLLQAYMPLEIVILISILSRLWTTIADLFLGIYGLLTRRIRIYK